MDEDINEKMAANHPGNTTASDIPEVNHPEREIVRPEVTKIIQHAPYISLRVKDNDLKILHSTALLSKQDRLNDDRLAVHRNIFRLATLLKDESKPSLVVSLRSGKLAAAIFEKQKCLVHTTSSRYTVRKGQGKAQSAQDGQRRPKSIGSQLRRAGEQMLKEDITNMVKKWKTMIDNCALIFLSTPKASQKDFYESVGSVFEKDDPRIRRVPFDAGKPSFENVCIIYDVVMTVRLGDFREENIDSETAELDVSEKAVTATTEQSMNPTREPRKPEPVAIEMPLTALHEALRDGEIDRAWALMEENPEEVNLRAGDSLSTPLHFAASNTANVDIDRVSRLVYGLIIEGKADPSILDIRDRPPYYLAGHDKIRDAFRRARADLGEEYCDWDKTAKVGPPITEEDVENKRMKEAEKRKRKKARQKAVKAKEKEAAAQLKAEQEAEEAKKKEEIDAKRIRDGLELKPDGNSNSCDFCQKPGRRRAKMFTRLDYMYCSMECVNKHKRELMAKAALSRFDS